MTTGGNGRQSILWRGGGILGTLAATAVGIWATCAPALAKWPERPVTLVVPFAAGGITDVLARLTAERLQQRLGQTFVVENEAGGAGIIAATRVARAEPDGQTLFFTTISQMTIAPFTHRISYDPVRDFAPIGLVATSPFVVTVSGKVAAGSLAELIALAKAAPDKLTFGSAGPGSVSHLSMAVFLKSAGIAMAHVPYRGVGPAFQDLLAGHIDAMAPTPVELRPYLGNGLVKPLALTGSGRSKALPGVPAIVETVADFPPVVTWNGVVAPAATPPAVIATLVEELHAAAQDPVFRGRLDAVGVDPSDVGPADLARLIAADTERWRGIVAELGLKPPS